MRSRIYRWSNLGFPKVSCEMVLSMVIRWTCVLHQVTNPYNEQRKRRGASYNLSAYCGRPMRVCLTWKKTFQLCDIIPKTGFPVNVLILCHVSNKSDYWFELSHELCSSQWNISLKIHICFILYITKQSWKRHSIDCPIVCPFDLLGRIKWQSSRRGVEPGFSDF